MIGFNEVMAFLSAGMMAMAAASWGMRYGCFAAIACASGAGFMGFILAYAYWMFVEEFGDYSTRLRQSRRLAGNVILAIYALAMLVPWAAALWGFRAILR